ncbi:MAG: thioesterase [Cytophagales bacterium]|nr:thioesterase [Cytophagales bacterium]
MDAHKRAFTVIWANLDPNRHMRHSAYNDYAAQVRLEFFTEFGLDLKSLSDQDVGAILSREETKFFKEVGLIDKR